MKKITVLLTSLFLILSLSFNTFALNSGAFSWYIKRNGNKRPILDESQKIIYQYNGCYIDERLSDDSSTKKIYLTFDLGYTNENVNKILDVMKRENVSAAFFVLDNIILKNTELVTEMIDDGHLICNHSKNHKNLSCASPELIQEDLLSLEKTMLSKTGMNLSKFFRFPEGRYSEQALKAVSELGYKTVFWSFAYDDWDNGRQPNPEKAFNKVISNTHNGAVMLFHPTSKTNADIFEKLIKAWKEMGYSFGSLNDLA
jgi:peptidoglycan-N-acetylmuramic acid deacetylase